MGIINQKAKDFLKLWADLSPYSLNGLGVINDKENYMIYFVQKDLYDSDFIGGNLGRFEYHMHQNDLSGFESLDDKQLYTFNELIDS